MSSENTLIYSFFCLFLCYNLEGYFYIFLRQALMAYSSLLAPFSFEQRLVVQSTDDIRNGKTSQASQPTVMGVLKSMELQYDLDPRGRHLAKAAGSSTSGDNQRTIAQQDERMEYGKWNDGITHIIPGWQYGAEGIRQMRLV